MLFAQVFTFLFFFILIAFEDVIRVNKTASALFAGVLCWIFCLPDFQIEHINESLGHNIKEIAEIVFFLLSAMIIVELIDVHEGFFSIARLIFSSNKTLFLIKVTIVTFFASALIDNLTTSIVMIAIIRKIIKDSQAMMFYASLVILCSNAGGAWSPLGDVTTTMLWIGGQVSTFGIIKSTLIPSIIFSVLVLVYIYFRLKNIDYQLLTLDSMTCVTSKFARRIILITGISVFFFVPIFKTLTHLPPYIGMLMGLAILWLTSELIHYKKDTAEREAFSASHAISRIDSSSILFFLGILLAVGSLQMSGVLSSLSDFLTTNFSNTFTINVLLGVVSAFVDNVPLVAASIKMFDMNTYPQDHVFWKQLAFCTGTGGSILIIGSASGVAVMGLTNIKFMWYLKNISIPTLLIYLISNMFFIR